MSHRGPWKCQTVFLCGAGTSPRPPWPRPVRRHFLFFQPFKNGARGLPVPQTEPRGLVSDPASKTSDSPEHLWAAPHSASISVHLPAPDPAAVSVRCDGAHSDCLDPAAAASAPTPEVPRQLAPPDAHARAIFQPEQLWSREGEAHGHQTHFCHESQLGHQLQTSGFLCRAGRPALSTHAPHLETCRPRAMRPSVPLPHTPVCEPWRLPRPCLPLSENASVQHDTAERAAPQNRGGGSTQAPPGGVSRAGRKQTRQRGPSMAPPGPATLPSFPRCPRSRTARPWSCPSPRGRRPRGGKGSPPVTG